MFVTNDGGFYKYIFVFISVAASVLTSIQGHTLEFAVEPLDTIVESGHSAVLDCVVKQHDPNVVIQWLDQDRQVLTFIGDSYRSQLVNGSLYINSVVDGQGLTGTYQCMASVPNVGSMVSRTAKLSLASLSGFHQEPRDVTAYLHQKAYFACRVQASPPPRIRWLKDERPLQIDELRMTILPTGALEIDEVQELDQGTYRCNATGVNSYRLSNKAALIINGDEEQAASISPPSFIASPESQTVAEKDNITLDCAANGNPKPKITWLKDGFGIDMADLDSRFSLVGATSSLRITNIQEADAGVYQCRAANPEDSLDASATIEVQVPPKFLIKPEDKVEFEHKDVELECSIYGKPKPEVQWLKNGEVIHANDYYQFVNGHNLKIMGLMTSDSGIFQCVAENPAGNIQTSASLKVFPSGEVSGVFRDDERRPGPPKDLKALVVEARFVVLSWKPPVRNSDDIVAYSMYYQQEGSERERVQNTSKARLEDISIGSLQPARVYHFRVVAYNNYSQGESSEVLTVTTRSEENVPSAPQNFNAFATSSRSVHVSWRKPEIPNGELLGYKVYYMETSSSEEHSVETKETEFDIAGLSVYTEYSLWVVAVNHNGHGAATDEKVVRTFSALPSDPPHNVTLEPASTSIMVRWEPPPLEGQNGPITGYKLRYRQQGKKGDTITTPPNQRMHNLFNLERGVLYQVRLWAINVNGTGPPTEWFDVETYENDLDESRHPDAPSPLRVRPSSDSILVGWSPPINQNIKIRNYIIGWGKGFPDTHIQEIDEKQRTFLIEHLEPNSDYVISLRASNEMGAGPPVYANVRTQDELPPEAQKPLYPPVGLKAQILSPNSVVLYWTDSALSKSQYVRDNRYYVVRYTSLEKNARTRYVNATNLNVMIDDLKPNTVYEFAVKLVKGSKESPYSMVVQNKTEELALSAEPRDLKVQTKKDNPQVVELTWQPPKMLNGRITGYVILYTDDPSKSDPEWSAEAINGDHHSCILSNLRPLTTYYFKIQARNSRGYGPYSKIVTYRTTEKVGIGGLDKRQQTDGMGMFSGKILLYLIVGGCLCAILTISGVIVVLCCRRRESTSSPDRSKKGYQKGAQNIKPPDLWIHHDQMELKALEKSNNDGASGSGATTLPRNVGISDYDGRESHHSNSLDKRSYVPNYMGVASDDKNSKRNVKPKPITLPVDAKPPREPIATATPVNTSLNSASSDTTPSGRPAYPRTQYTISRAHVTIDQNALASSQAESPYASHTPHSSYESGPYISQVPPPVAHVPPGSTYAPGMNVLAESQAVKRVTNQGHPLKSFTVPAPPPISAPGTPQPKHAANQPQVLVRPNSSPYKKASTSSSSTLTGTPPSRISAANPPPHTAEEVQRLQPSHSTEELNQEMANLEGLMLTLNAITANEFEC